MHDGLPSRDPLLQRAAGADHIACWPHRATPARSGHTEQLLQGLATQCDSCKVWPHRATPARSGHTEQLLQGLATQCDSCKVWPYSATPARSGHTDATAGAHKRGGRHAQLSAHRGASIQRRRPCSTYGGQRRRWGMWRRTLILWRLHHARLHVGHWRHAKVSGLRWLRAERGQGGVKGGKGPQRRGRHANRAAKSVAARATDGSNGKRPLPKRSRALQPSWPSCPN